MICKTLRVQNNSSHYISVEKCQKFTRQHVKCFFAIKVSYVSYCSYVIFFETLTYTGNDIHFLSNSLCVVESIMIILDTEMMDVWSNTLVHLVRCISSNILDSDYKWKMKLNMYKDFYQK